jgi:hypothetical protein
MNPEEISRTIEFIIQHQAQTAIQMEQFSAQLKEEHEKRIEFQEWSIDLHWRVAELLDHQSRRLDWFQQFMRETREWQQAWQTTWQTESQKSQKRHEEALAKLDRILDKLSDQPN